MVKQHTESEIIDIILGVSVETDRRSTMMLALHTARYNCGRDVKTGAKWNGSFEFRHNRLELINQSRSIECFENLEDEACMFSSLLSYFIVLEQIGTIFCPKIKGISSIEQALTYYSDIEDTKTRNALYNVRNALVHSYGVATERKSNPYLYEIKFKDTDCVISHPNEDWNVDYENKENVTTVSFLSVCDLVEQVYKRVIELHKMQQIRLEISINEARCRYTILV